MATDKYIIKDGKVVPATLLEWGRFLQDNERRVIFTTIGRRVRVSTIFMGLDHRWNNRGAPLIYETMIFAEGLKHLDTVRSLYSTRAQAIRGHKIAIEEVREFLPKAKVTTVEFETGVLLET